MAAYVRLMLKLPFADLKLIEALLMDVKRTLGPIARETDIARHNLNPNYLNAVTLDRAVLAAEITYLACPELMGGQAAVIYLFDYEFSTLLRLLELGGKGTGSDKERLLSLWTQLAIAEINYNDQKGQQ